MPGRCLILQCKNTGYWLTVGGDIVAVILLVATEFRGFLCALYDVTPIFFIKKWAADFGPSSYFTYLAAVREALSSHVTMKYVTSSSTSLDKTSPLIVYVTNH